MKFPKKWIDWLIFINLLITLPTFFYLQDAEEHWLLHLMSLSASKFFIPCFFLYLLWYNRTSWRDILKNNFNVIAFLVLCFLYFPTYIGDLRFIDKYDWFTVPAKVLVWAIVLAPTLINLFTKEE